MFNEPWARSILLQAWKKITGSDEPPALAALQLVGAVCRHESSYGKGWRGTMTGSHNWGAMQCNARPDAQGHCPPGCRATGDSHANGKTYLGCFREYASDLDGATDVVKWFLTKPGFAEIADTGDVYRFVKLMHDWHYYEGRGTDEEAVNGYRDVVLKNAEAIAAGMGERVCVRDDGPAWTPA